MHQVVEAQGQQVQQRPLQREDRRRDKELLEGREPELPVEDGQHLLLGGDDVAHDAAIVEEAVVIPVLGVEVDLHRHHKIHRGDQNRQKRQHGGHIVIWRAIKQALHLDAERTAPCDHQMGEQADGGQQSGQRQRQKLIDPLQKQPRMLTTLRKITMQQEHIPHQHHTIAKHHRKQQRLHRRAGQRKQHA